MHTPAYSTLMHREIYIGRSGIRRDDPTHTTAAFAGKRVNATCVPDDGS
jgi:hypothetical protein